MARYTTLLFDADDTLLDFRRSEHEAILDAIGYMGIAPSEEMARVYSEINHAAWKRLERGEITKADFDYPGASISVTVAPDGRVVRYQQILKIDGVGEGAAMGMTASGKILGEVNEVWEISY